MSHFKLKFDRFSHERVRVRHLQGSAAGRSATFFHKGQHEAYTPARDKVSVRDICRMLQLPAPRAHT